MITNSAWYSAPVDPKPSAPTVNEQQALTAHYLRWLADQRGIELPAHYEIEASGIWTGRGDGRTCIVAMPGYGVSKDWVEVEELDDAGEVLRVSRLPLKANATLPWNATKLRQVAGKSAKSPSVRPIRTEAPAPIKVATVADSSAAPAGLLEIIQTLTDRLTQMENQLAAITSERPGGEALSPSIGELAVATGEMAPWRGARELAQLRADHAADQRQAERSRRLRIVRRYLAMRRERASIIAQRSAWKARADEWRERAGEGFALRDAVATDAEQLDIRLNAALAENAKLKARPHHFGNEVRPDDLRRVTEDRDAARKALASATEQCDRLARATDKGADILDAMTERALRAEIALKALEARREREGAPTPYRVNLTSVSFGVAA